MEKCRDQDSAKLIDSTVTVEDHPFHLPTKIWEKVFALVDLDDVKAIRLAWRRWTNIAARFLFDFFVFSVDRNDLERMEIIQQHPNLLGGIKNVRFEIGTMGLEYIEHRLGLKYLGEYNSMRLPEPKNAIAPENLEPEIDAAITEYAAWNTRWHDCQQNYRDLPRMKSIFAKLKTLDCLAITPKACSFTNSFLLDAWIGGCHNRYHKRATKEFITILMALQGTKLNLKHLAHDQIPVSFFLLKESLLANLAGPLFYLTSLRLTLDATSFPHTRVWNGLGKFLQGAPNLKYLRFGFAPFEAGKMDKGTWQDERQLELWYLPLWKMLGDFTWSYLEDLRLDGLLVCEVGLFQLLSRHANTLRALDLYNMGLWQGSFRGLLYSLQSVLSLKRFGLRGTTHAHHSPFEAWRLPFGFDPMAECWPLKLMEHVIESEWKYVQLRESIDDISSPGVVHKLESFLQSGDTPSWTLYPSDAINFMMYPPAFRGRTHTDKCVGCMHSIDEINKAWDAGMKKPLEGWQDYTSKDTPGIGEEAVVNFYAEVAMILGDMMRMDTMKRASTISTSLLSGRELRILSATILHSEWFVKVFVTRSLTTRNSCHNVEARIVKGAKGRMNAQV